MKQIWQGDCVFVLLNDEYLRSPYWMFELFEIWCNSRREDEFLMRSRVYYLDDRQIGMIIGCSSYTKYWKTQNDQIWVAIDEPGARGVATKDLDDFELMQQFDNLVGNILRMFPDIVQPRTFEDLVKYGLDHPPGSAAPN